MAPPGGRVLPPRTCRPFWIFSFLNFFLADKTLKVPKENVSLAAPAGGAVVLPCPLEEVRSPAALYSVSWYYQAAPLSYPSLLYRMGWEGVTEYKEALAGRLQVAVAVRGNYSLILRSVGAEDAGIYHCQVQEWRLQDDRWRVEASDTSGYLQLRVTTPGKGRPPGPHLEHGAET